MSPEITSEDYFEGIWVEKKQKEEAIPILEQLRDLGVTEEQVIKWLRQNKI